MWKVKQELWQEIAQWIPHDPYLSIVYSFPEPVYHFARAYRCRSYRRTAAYGYDQVVQQTFFGFRARVRLAWLGMIVDCILVTTDLHYTQGAVELVEGVYGYAITDLN